MSNIGSMTADLGLNYSDFVRGLSFSKSELQRWQSDTGRLSQQSGKYTAGAAMNSGQSTILVMRSAGTANRGLLGSMGSLLGTTVGLGVKVASVYGSWKLNSLSVKTQLLQQEVAMRQLAAGPGRTPGMAAYANQILASNRQTKSLWRTTLILGGAIAGIGTAAAVGYGAWRMHSAKMRTELLQQRLLTQQIKAGRSGGMGMGGIGIGGVGLGVAMGGGIGHLAGMAAQVPAKSLSLASDAEQAQISFEVLLGSAGKAEKMLSEIKTFANASPFNLAGLAENVKTMMSFDIQAQDVVPSLRMLGDVALGDKDKLNHLALAFGQVTANGKLAGDDLRQLVNVGFNPLQEIGKKTGESMAELRKRMEGGQISALEVRDAFVAATSAGGRFHDGTNRQAQSLAGKWSTAMDGIDESLRALGTSLITNFDIKGWVDTATAWVGTIPALFTNNGALMKAELLNWQIAFLELVPGAEDMTTRIGIVLSASWDALSGSFTTFIDTIKAGFTEILNLAQAAGSAVSAGASGSWETFKTYATLGYAGEKGAANPFHGMNKAWDAGVGTLAHQDNAMKPGEDFATKFVTEFNRSAAASIEGMKGMPSLTDNLKSQRAELLQQVATTAATDAAKPKIDFGGKPGASFNPGKGSESNKGDSSHFSNATAALKGTSAAASIMTNQSELIQHKQIAILERIAKTLADQAKGSGVYSESKTPTF